MNGRLKQVWNCWKGAVAHLGLARAYILQGDTDKARAAYQDFLTLWKDADHDIPILKQAKAEYETLQFVQFLSCIRAPTARLCACQELLLKIGEVRVEGGDGLASRPPLRLRCARASDGTGRNAVVDSG
jgi:hypothetical protein